MNILCLAKGTKVLLEKNISKSIEDVTVGDYVSSLNLELFCVENVRVEYVAKAVHSKMLRIVLANDMEVLCTVDHPIFLKDKRWCSFAPKKTTELYKINVGEVVVGDECLTYQDGQLLYSEIMSLNIIEGEFEMYDISGGTNHNFFANSILVHDENLKDLVESGKLAAMVSV